jgi:hypothetical protein
MPVFNEISWLFKENLSKALKTQEKYFFKLKKSSINIVNVFLGS